MNIRKYLPFFLTILFVSISFITEAQCAMCKGSVQTSQYARSINGGIEYLLAAPIVLVAGIIIIWIKNKDDFNKKE